jgi:hypothetical protein
VRCRCKILSKLTQPSVSFFALSLEPVLDYYPARVTIKLTMPRDIIEIASEPDSRSRSAAASSIFASQHAAMLAEHEIQNSDIQLHRRRTGLPSWLALAVATGAAVAVAFVYFLAR